MAQARVELRGCLTHLAPVKFGGRTLKKGSPVILTKPSEIQYYREQGVFSVTFLKRAPAPVEKEVVVTAPVVVEENDGKQEQYSKSQLAKLKPSELEIVMDDLGLEGADELTKSEKIKAILLAQAEQSDDDGEEEA